MTDITKSFVKGAEASKILNISQQTLRKYADNGTIEVTITPGGHRLYNVKKYLKNDDTVTSGYKICYCRVSSYSQKEDYKRQVRYMKDKYPNYKIVGDVGSGINFKRKGLLKIIDLAIQGKVDTLVVSYKDRLCRIGYDLIEFILKTYSNTTIIIDQHKAETVQEEISNDLIEIMTVYTAKISGMRSYKAGETKLDGPESDMEPDEISV